MDKIKVRTRNIPVSAKARFNALMRKEKGDTGKVAERLGVSRRQVQRLAAGTRDIEKSKKSTLDALEREVRKDHQPRVKARAEKEAKERGVFIHTRAQFGFTSAGESTDDARYRLISEDMPPELIGDIVEALHQEDEARLQELIGEGLAREYFRSPEIPGTQRERLDVTFGDIDYIEMEWGR
jgi:hypothetical protein